MNYIYKNKKTGLYFDITNDTNDLKKALIIEEKEVWSYLKYHYEKISYNQELQDIRKLKLKKLNEF